MRAEPNLHTPRSKQNGIRRLLLAGHKKSCLLRSGAALQKGNHEKEEKTQDCSNGAVASPAGDSSARGAAGKED